MTRTISRRKLLHAGGGAITTVGFSALAGKLTSETLHAQSLPVRSVKEVDSAHIIGAKTGGAVAMRFAADYPKRTRSLVVVGGPASPLVIADPSPIPQRDRLGSNASKEMIAYWNTLFSRPDREGVEGLSKSLSNFDLAKEGVLQRITAPTLVITADRSKMHSVEKARAYQVQIPNSRLVVIRSDAYHIAAANADECVTHTLAFLKEQKT